MKPPVPAVHELPGFGWLLGHAGGGVMQFQFVPPGPKPRHVQLVVP